MATVPNISGLTIGAEEVYDVNQVIAQKLWQDENFLKLHRVVSGISKKTQILLDASAGRAGWKATGCASIVSGGMDIKMAELFWDTVTLEDTLEFCQSDLDSNFKLLVKRNAKDNFASLEDQEAINTFVMAKAYVFISEMIERYIWLGDKDAENTEDGGYVNNDVNIKYFTALDGIFKQAIAGVGTGVTKRFTIAKNALATKALQLGLTDAEAFAIVKGVYDNAPDVTKLDTEAYIWVTPAVYNGYKNYLATNTLSGGGLSVFTIDGVQKVAYQGVPVVTSLFIGKEILATTTILDGESPAQATYNLPHRAIMSTPDLLPIATLNEDDIKALESFYVQLDRKSYVRFDVDLDVKVVRPEYISVAY